jgi:hypothetical protein
LLVAEQKKLLEQKNMRFDWSKFLHVECKHAICLEEFVGTLDVRCVFGEKDTSISEEIAFLICKALENLKETQRPFHCIDGKRNKVYVKRRDKWSIESSETLEDVFRDVQNKYVAACTVWQTEHTNWMHSDTESKEFAEMVQRVVAPLDLMKSLSKVLSCAVVCRKLS